MASPRIYQVANLQTELTTTADSANNRVLRAGDTMTGELNVANNLVVTGNVGIGTTSPAAKLDVDGQIISRSTSPLSFLSSNNTGTWNRTVIYAAQNNTSGSVENGIFIERGRITDSDQAEVRNFVIGSRGGQTQFIVTGPGNVGIGTTNPYTTMAIGTPAHFSPDNTNRILNWWGGTGSELHNSVHRITIGVDSSSTTQPQLVGMHLFNSNTTDGNWSPILMFGGLSTNSNYMNGTAGIAAKLPGNVDDSNFRSGDLHFFTQGTTNAGRGLTSKLVISGNGNVYTNSGSAISYGSGETYNIWSNEPEYSVTHSDANWKDMKTFVCSKSGNLKFKFSAFISSGTYYWAWRILQNGSTTVASGAFDVGLDSGETASVHAYRRFVASVGPIAAGDSLVLQMISSTGGGTPATGVGQILYAKEFRAYSTVPSDDNGRSLNVFGTNDSQGLSRNYNSKRYYYSDWKLIGSNFDNPVQNLVTVPTAGQTNSNITVKLRVIQGLFASNQSNEHEGMASAMWTGSAWSFSVDTMVKRVGNLTNVGTLAFSGNTLRYTGNRGSNYDGYLLAMEVWQTTNLGEVQFHI